MQIVGFVISMVALLIVSLTMFARANDLRWKKGIRWNVRLAGFILSGTAPIGVVGVEMAYQNWPTLYEVMFRVGIMFVFVTTPHLPPWHKWMTRGEKDE